MQKTQEHEEHSKQTRPHDSQTLLVYTTKSEA